MIPAGRFSALGPRNGECAACCASNCSCTGTHSARWTCWPMPRRPSPTSPSTSASPDESEHVGLLLASHAAIAAADAYHFEHVTSALVNRDLIGQAKGILMERFKITSDQAFAVLAKVSQDTNRKVSAVAEDLARTGMWTPGLQTGPHREDTP